MTARSFMNSAGAKMSRAGVDVTTALPVDLLFDSDFSYPAIEERGEFTLTMGQVLAGGNHDVFFNKSYSTPPFVLFALNDRGVWHWGHNPMFLSAFVETRNSSGDQIRAFHILGKPLTNRIQLSFNVFQQNNNLGTNLALHIKYAVLGFQQ